MVGWFQPKKMAECFWVYKYTHPTYNADPDLVLTCPKWTIHIFLQQMKRWSFLKYSTYPDPEFPGANQVQVNTLFLFENMVPKRWFTFWILSGYLKHSYGQLPIYTAHDLWLLKWSFCIRSITRGYHDFPCEPPGGDRYPSMPKTYPSDIAGSSLVFQPIPHK